MNRSIFTVALATLALAACSGDATPLAPTAPADFNAFKAPDSLGAPPQSITASGTFNAPLAATALQPFTLSLTKVSVKGATSKQPIRYAFDCGDGSGYSDKASSSSRSCTGRRAGPLAVSARAYYEASIAPAEWHTVVIITAPVLKRQSIAFTTTAPATMRNGQKYVVRATATSGLKVTFSLTAAAENRCTLIPSPNGVTVQITALQGTCAILANQSGNATYAAAPEVRQSIVIAPLIEHKN